MNEMEIEDLVGGVIEDVVYAHWDRAEIKVRKGNSAFLLRIEPEIGCDPPCECEENCSSDLWYSVDELKEEDG